jgi:alanine dehydrogenase
MIIGIPKEIKDHETRVALLPEAVRALLRRGHEVLVQSRAGEGAGYSDAEYREAGARLVSSARGLYQNSQLIVKVKEPLPREYGFFRKDLLLFCFLHLAANPKLTLRLVRSGITALGFETLEDRQGGTPLLKPMSEIAGRLASQLAVQYLRSDLGGKGVLLSPTEYSEPGRVVIIGGGNVGRASAEVAAGLGARVLVLDRYPGPLRRWAQPFPNIELSKSSPGKIARALLQADLVVGAVYIPGARTPRVIRREMVKNMEKGSVLIDVAVDQGGASETTRPTTISHPVYELYGVLHCAITNMPALVGRTSSKVLSRVILPYVLEVARRGSAQELLQDRALHSAVNVSGGRVIHPQVAASLAGC